jgi:ribosomal protein S18 acetylase RimI-like enzyme
MMREFRNPVGDDYDRVIVQLDDWWGGRNMQVRLPRLWFDHFSDTSFVVEEDGAITAFLIGFLSSVHRNEAYIHFVGVDPKRRDQGLGRGLYERFFALAAERGRQAVGDAFMDGLPVHTGFHGPGEDRVVFRRKISSRDVQGPGQLGP